MYFSNAGAAVNSVPLVWAIVGTANFFEQFSMGGVDEQFDEIWLTFSPEQLSNALNIFKYSIKSIKMKLTKKQFPCLSIDVEVVGQNSQVSPDTSLMKFVPFSYPQIQERHDAWLTMCR